MAGFIPGGIGYGRPAGLPDTGGVLAPQQGGLFGSYSAPAGGIFSALKDAAAYLGGGGSTDNFAQYNAQQQQTQIRQQLLQGLTSEDPATRQQAYGYANLLGIPTDGFQKQQAAQALPKLLQSMQPSTQTVSAMPAPLPMGPQFAPQTMDYQKPGANLSDALAQSGSPELQAQYAPQIIQDTLQRQEKAVRPATAQEKAAAGLSSDTPAQVNSYGQITPINDPNQMTAYQSAELKHGDATAAETRRHNLADEANSAGDAGGGLSDGAKVNAAVKFNLTGVLPPFGMGKAARGDRLEVLNYAAQLATGKTTPEQLVTQAANYKANSASLNQQTKQFNSIEQNANTAKNSINLALASAKAGGAGPSDSPVFNRWVQAGRVAINGDPQVQSLQNHLSAFAEDYAKVMTANTSSAGATDSARAEAYKRLSAANSVANLQQISGEMMKEMGGRHYAARAQIGAIQKQLGGGGYSEPAGVQTAAPAAALPRLPVSNPQTDALLKKYGVTQ